MLHELLVALYGYPGSIFTLNAQKQIKIVDTLPFCHTGEIDILNRICRLATSYYRLLSFINEKTGSECGKNDRGIYIRAFCNGLKKSLAPYRQSLLKLEQEILRDPHLTVSYVQYSLEKFQLLLPSLVYLVDEISSKEAHGCQILEIVNSHSSSGLPIVFSVINKILCTCHGVLFRTLTEWLLYGILEDPNGEFFVAISCERNTEAEKTETEKIEAEEGRAVTSKSTFVLKGHMIPSYIPVHLAEMILFVGESVHMFERSGSSLAFRDRDSDSSTLRDKKDGFARDLYELQHEEEMQIAKLETIVDNIRCCTSEYLWTLVVENSDLGSRLRALKDFYLLGRGDLFTSFIEQSTSLLNIPPTTNTQHLVKQTFRSCCIASLHEDEAHLKHFNIVVDQKPRAIVGEVQLFRTVHASNTGWNCLRIEYFASWPLHTIFTPDVIDRFNVVFQFLLNVKRVQIELHKCWALQIQAKHCREAIGDPAKWQLRSSMAFIVDNLQYYLQVDVLESQYNILLERIRNTRDFQQVQNAFHTFLTNILVQTFLLMKSVSKCLQEFLELCLSYCAILCNSPKSDSSQVQTYSKQFNAQSTLLLKLLSEIQCHQASHHISQFLMRVDFNKYFSSAKVNTFRS